MPRPTIDQIRQVGDFAALYRWDVNLILPAGLTGVTAEQLNFRCESTAIPKLTNESMTINIRGHKVKQPGIGTYTNTLELTFVETVDAVVHNFIKSWRELIWQTKTGVAAGSKADLQGTLILQQLNNQDQAFWEYTSKGVYIEDYELGTMGVESDAQRPTITFSYDYFEDKQLT